MYQDTPTWKCALVASDASIISLVDVPLRIGSHSPIPLTAMDLDVFLWVSLPESRVTPIVDITANQITVSQFPFDGPNVLDGIYTFYFQEQVSALFISGLSTAEKTVGLAQTCQ